MSIFLNWNDDNTSNKSTITKKTTLNKVLTTSNEVIRNFTTPSSKSTHFTDNSIISVPAKEILKNITFKTVKPQISELIIEDKNFIGKKRQHFNSNIGFKNSSINLPKFSVLQKDKILLDIDDDSIDSDYFNTKPKRVSQENKDSIDSKKVSKPKFKEEIINIKSKDYTFKTNTTSYTEYMEEKIKFIKQTLKDIVEAEKIFEPCTIYDPNSDKQAIFNPGSKPLKPSEYLKLKNDFLKELQNTPVSVETVWINRKPFLFEPSSLNKEEYLKERRDFVEKYLDSNKSDKPEKTIEHIDYVMPYKHIRPFKKNNILINYRNYIEKTRKVSFTKIREIHQSHIEIKAAEKPKKLDLSKEIEIHNNKIMELNQQYASKNISGEEFCSKIRSEVEKHEAYVKYIKKTNENIDIFNAKFSKLEVYHEIPKEFTTSLKFCKKPFIKPEKLPLEITKMHECAFCKKFVRIKDHYCPEFEKYKNSYSKNNVYPNLKISNIVDLLNFAKLYNLDLTLPVHYDKNGNFFNYPKRRACEICISQFDKKTQTTFYGFCDCEQNIKFNLEHSKNHTYAFDIQRVERHPHPDIVNFLGLKHDCNCLDDLDIGFYLIGANINYKPISDDEKFNIKYVNLDNFKDLSFTFDIFNSKIQTLNFEKISFKDIYNLNHFSRLLDLQAKTKIGSFCNCFANDKNVKFYSDFNLHNSTCLHTRHQFSPDSHYYSKCGHIINDKNVCELDVMLNVDDYGDPIPNAPLYHTHISTSNDKKRFLKQEECAFCNTLMLKQSLKKHYLTCTDVPPNFNFELEPIPKKPQVKNLKDFIYEGFKGYAFN